MAQDDNPAAPFAAMMQMQTKIMQDMLGTVLPAGQMPDAPMMPFPTVEMSPSSLEDWQAVSQKLQMMWQEFQAEQSQSAEPKLALVDPLEWLGAMQNWYRQMPISKPDAQKQLWEKTLELWQTVLGRYGIGPEALEEKETDLPRSDRRFKDRRWSDQPAFALIHQTYLLISERLHAMVDEIEGLDDAKRKQLRFATKAMIEAMSPANFPTLNPLVIERTLETKGESLVSGMENLFTDLKRGQLTHTDPDAFTLGENIAASPGKVVHETPLYQVIQYSPTTPTVLETPLVIFPPWINRFYILDLNPKNSFIRWAVEQGVTTFVVSWKSADSSMSDIVWGDYIRAQIDVIDYIRERLKVPSVHTIGYCVAGTTLAAALAILHARDQQDKVKSATFFTAQVDFANAGDLLHFIDDQQLAGIEKLCTDGYLDGRYMAAAFNLLRGNSLIWNYWVDNYLMGNGYPAFDLLHWNGDVTNLPAKWHQAYLRDLYRDNKLIQPGALEADGEPIDLRLVKTPSYVQAGKEDHIAPAESVWEITNHFNGPLRFVLAGSGHIAGVVNPPESGKYQYWTNTADPQSLGEFIAGATETAGSWWPDWIEWLRSQDTTEIPVKGKRKPGGKGDKTIEDAPGRYVMTR